MKTIVLSGASRGIGKEIALRFAKEGFKIAAYSRSESKLKDLEDEIRASNQSTEIFTLSVDAKKPEQIKAFADAVREKWGRVDVLVNNAGIFLPDNVLNAEEGKLEEMMQINLFASHQLTRSLIDLIPEDGESYIFNLCSIASLRAYPAGNLYAVTKHAMLGFSRALREELIGKVRVSNVMPGATFTDSWKGNTELPEKRFMDPKDIAEIIWQAYSLSSRTVVEDIVLRPLKGDI